MPRRLLTAVAVLAALTTFVVDLPLAGADDDPGATTTTTTTAPTTTTTAPPPTTVQPPPPPVTPPPPPAPVIDWNALIAFFKLIFPPVPENSGRGRRIVYSNARQRVWLVGANEKVEKTYLVSGRANTPRRGFYRVYSKSRHAFSGSARMEFMIRFARGRSLAIGFHSIPTTRGRPMQSEAQLGTYQSHGCVRQRWLDALWLWWWAPVGTPVVVMP